MASRTLTVPIIGDASSLHRAFRSIDQDADRSSKRMRTWAKVGAGAIAAVDFGIVAVALKSVVGAASDAERSQTQLATQLKAIGTTYSAHAKQIDEVIQKHSQLSGLDDEDLADSFTNIVRVTENVNKALKLTGLAADFARAKHMEVAKAGELVGKVAGGNTGILSRYGIQIDKGATATEALGILQRKFAGQAEAYGKTSAGAGNRVSVAWENVREDLGKKLLPTVTRLGNKFADFLNQIVKNEGAGGRFRDSVEDVADALEHVLKVGRDVGKWLTDHKELVELAAGAWVAYKVAVKGALLVSGVKGLAAKTIAAPAAAAAGGAAATAAAGGAAAGAGGATAARAASVGRLGGPVGILATVAGFQQLSAILKGYAKQDSGIKVFQRDLDRLASTHNQQGLIELADKVRDYARVNNDLFSNTDKLEEFANRVEALGRKPVHATGRLKTSTDDLIGSVRKQISTTEDQINELAKHGRASDQTGEKVDKLRDKQKRLRDELARLKSKSISVRVRLDFNTAMNASPGSDRAQGDVAGDVSLTQRVRAGVKANANRLLPPGIFGGGAFGGGNLGGLQIEARQGLAFLRSRFGGLTLSSGFRSEAENARVGGAPRSDHLSGLATDLVPAEGWTPGGIARLDRVAAWARSSPLIRWIGWRGVPGHGPGDHMHLSWVDRVAGDVAMVGGQLKGYGGKVRGAGDVMGLSALANLWTRAGGDPGVNLLMAHIAMAESGGDTRAHNPSGATGLWQILGEPFAGDAFNPLTNAKMAVWKYKHQGLGAWAASRGTWGRFLNSRRSTGGGAPGAGGGGGGVASKVRGGQAGIGRAGVGGGGFSPSTQFKLGTAGNLARAGVQRAKAEARDDLSGLIAAMTDERKIKKRRLHRIRRVLKGRIGQKRRTRLMGEEAQLIGEIAELTAAIKEYTADQAGGATTISAADELDAGVASGSGTDVVGDEGWTRLDSLNADMAKAGLTPGLEDDIATATGIRDYWQAAYDAALGTPDPRDDTEAATNLKAAIDQLAQLNGNLEETNRIAEQDRQNTAQVLVNQAKILALANQGPTILAQLIAVLNEGIGSRLALNLQGPAYAPGKVAQY